MRLLLGGSPCTHWSIAQTKNRETEPSGLGWELFKNYLIAREKYKPDYFLYENNKSMSAAIREQITKELGVPPVLINSALVSAQNRQRLYWAGKRMPDGSYAPLDIQQPEDRGILLRHILESGISVREKGYCLSTTAGNTTPEDAFKRKHRNVAAEPVIKPLTEREMDYMVRETKDGRNHFDFGYHHDSTEDKSACVTANTHRGVPYNVLDECVNPTPSGKSRTVDAHMKNLEHCLIPRVNNPNPAKQQYDYIAETMRVDVLPEMAAMRQVGRRINAQGHRDDYNEEIPHFQYFEVNENHKKTNCLSTVQKDNMVALPVRIGTIDSDTKHPEHDSQQYRVYSPDGKSVTICGGGGGYRSQDRTVCSPGQHRSEAVNITTDGKAQCLRATYYKDGIRNMVGNTIDRKTCAAEMVTATDGKFEIQTADGKTYPIYEVKGGYITVKGKQYPIKLADGFYIIRKLTVTECKRLQTVPDSYIFPVSDSQAYKMLGNGWTVEVIAHILSHIPEITAEPVEVLSMYDGMSCGHLALDRLGAEVVGYFATEIDKYAIQTTQHNYPDTVQLGDAFQVREDGWRLPEAMR